MLDGGGYCCLSGMLDECGVCDGDGSSCQLHIVVTTQVLNLLHLCFLLPTILALLSFPPLTPTVAVASAPAFCLACAVSSVVALALAFTSSFAYAFLHLSLLSCDKLFGNIRLLSFY